MADPCDVETYGQETKQIPGRSPPVEGGPARRHVPAPGWL